LICRLIIVTGAFFVPGARLTLVQLLLNLFVNPFVILP
jgi:hypothetical protein